MVKIKDFLKSLIIPKYMLRHRYMSSLISILIFLAGMYLVMPPINTGIHKLAPQMKENYNFQIFIELEDNLIFPGENEGETINDNEQVLVDLAKLECVYNAKEGILECPKLGANEVFERIISYEVDGITKKLDIVVNLKDEIEVKDLVYDLTTKPYVENEETYLLYLTKTYLYFQAHQSGINDEEIKHNEQEIKVENRAYDYLSYMPEFNIAVDEVNARGLGLFFLDNIVLADVKNIISSYSLFSFFYLFIIPLLFTFVFWLTFRRRGKLKKFKEYYNMAAISAIVVLIIVFGISWFWLKILEQFMLIFPLYYLFILYRLNSLPPDDSDGPHHDEEHSRKLESVRTLSSKTNVEDIAVKPKKDEFELENFEIEDIVFEDKE